MYVFINRIKFKANITSANLIIFFFKFKKILISINYPPKSTTSVSTYTQKNNHIKQAPSPTKQQHQQAPSPTEQLHQQAPSPTEQQHQQAPSPTKNRTLSLSMSQNFSKDQPPKE